jgi:SAM-dependent methyltransferase
MIRFFGKILSGQSLARAMMNHAFRSYTISGKVVDVGGGRSPDYYEYLQKGSDCKVEPVDTSLSGINFESDHLPQADGTADTVICANVLEHIYNHNFLISEIRRIMKGGACFIGFVPFLVNYHPDPHDYFRYTEEALKKMFETAGFKEIDIIVVGAGPFAVNFNNITLSLPLVVKVSVFPIYTLFDWLFTTLRPSSRRRYPLGYVFSMRK